MIGASSFPPNEIARFQRLLDAFKAVSSPAIVKGAENKANLLLFGDDLLQGFRSAVEKWRVSQERTADDFNILGIMHLIERETLHSRVLAWLLDRDITRLGTHAQGNLGFKVFLAELQLPSSYANDENEYWVRTEVRGEESIIDVEVASKGKFLIHIENKIGAVEGVNQTAREWQDIRRRAEHLRIPAGRTHAFFLTLDGTPPDDSNFISITWSKIAMVFERFAAGAKAPEVKVFSSHYARSMRLISGQRSIKEAEDVEPSVQ